jgi:hypothetical protein
MAPSEVFTGFRLRATLLQNQEKSCSNPLKQAYWHSGKTKHFHYKIAFGHAHLRNIGTSAFAATNILSLRWTYLSQAPSHLFMQSRSREQKADQPFSEAELIFIVNEFSVLKKHRAPRKTHPCSIIEHASLTCPACTRRGTAPGHRRRRHVTGDYRARKESTAMPYVLSLA